MSKRAILSNQIKHAIDYNHQVKNDFLATMKLIGYQKDGIRQASYMLTDFIQWMGNTPLDQLNSLLMQQYLNYLQSRKNKVKAGGISTNYINKHLMVLRQFGRYLHDHCQLSIPLFLPNLKGGEPQSKYLSLPQILQLYEAIQDNDRFGQRDKVILGLFYGCGLRANEGIQVDVDDILWSSGLLRVRKGKNYTRRDVPVPVPVQEDIYDYLRYGRTLFLKGSDESSLLVNKYGGRLGFNGVYSRLQHLKRKAGIDRLFGLHTLRHSIATHLLQSGMELEQISRFLGHKSLESTQLYTHLAHESF